MKNLALLLASLFGFVTNVSAGEAIFGEWWTPGFNARVLIYPCGENACGKITWAWEETPPDIADKKPLVGQMIFAGHVKRDERKWEGRIYNPEDGRNYSSDVSLLTTVTLEVNGCVLMFCKRQVWRRFEAASCPQVAPVPFEGARAH
jgi:uncharacterized protein (DUF2147 family)